MVAVLSVGEEAKGKQRIIVGQRKSYVYTIMTLVSENYTDLFQLELESKGWIFEFLNQIHLIYRLHLVRSIWLDKAVVFYPCEIQKGIISDVSAYFVNEFCTLKYISIMKEINVTL
jgi:hypothetical protein